MRSLTRVALCCLLALPATAVAQQKRPDLVDVKAWRGTLTATAKPVQSKVTMGPSVVTFDYSATFTADFLLDEFEDEPATWTGKLVSSNFGVTSRMVSTNPLEKTERSYATSGPADARDGPDAKLTFHRERGWSLIVLRNTRRTEMTEVTTLDEKVVTDVPHVTTVKREHTARALPSVEKFPYPAEGFDLEGKAEMPPTDNSADMAIIWSYEVHIWPADRAMLTLEIEDSPAYEGWRPSTTPDAKAGYALALKATVVSSDGKTPNKKVESFVWELEKTSREPGVCINYPLNAKDDRFDLELTTEGGMFTVAMDGQRVDRAVQEGFEDTVRVLPFDWGGWADLKVTATLVGGEKLVGKIKGASEDGVRLPKRAADSKVADVWKKGKAGIGPDDCDFDDIPAVASHKGDGLSLYEEYRGFYEKGEHKEGAPGTKDLFVLDKTKGSVDGGLAKFQKESQIVIHRLAADEMDEDERLVNKNRSKGPHLVAQHGILIDFHPSGHSSGADRDHDKHADQQDEGGYMATEPAGAACPRDVKALYVPRVPVKGQNAADGTPFLAVSFAHELLHALGVRHHGDGDYDAYWKIEGDAVREFPLDDAGNSLGSGTLVQVLKWRDGSLTDVTAAFIAHRQGLGGDKASGQKQLIGVEQGESSGDDTCLMRYDRNSAYVIRDQPNARVVIEHGVNDEPVGFRICTSRTGTGINDMSPGRASRYGNAAPGRGACKEKIKVSDI